MENCVVEELIIYHKHYYINYLIQYLLLYKVIYFLYMLLGMLVGWVIWVGRVFCWGAFISSYSLYLYFDISTYMFIYLSFVC